MIQNEIIFDEPEEIYFNSKYNGSSMIKDYLKSPYGYYMKHVVNNQDFQFKKTPSVILGSVVDDMISGVKNYIEIPDEFYTPSGSVSSKKEYKDWVSQQKVEPVSRDVIAKAEFLCERLMTNSLAKSIIENSKKQVVGRMLEKETFCPIQARFDFFTEDGMIADLKTTSSFDKFTRFSFYDFGYDTQASLYTIIYESLVCDVTKYYLPVVETSVPYRVKVVDATSIIYNAHDKVIEACSGIVNKKFNDPDFIEVM